MNTIYQLNVNGKKVTVEATASTPLLYILRNELGLNGPKFGCGLQQCGSCMVLLNGVAQPSCGVPVSAVTQYAITTLEGLQRGEVLHPVQTAFVEEQASQCGYCLNGMVLSAVSLLNITPNPTDAEIRDGMQRCLCRCGTQSRVLRAIQRVINKKSGSPTNK
ncbi:MAG: (2Fe-2S)-binding protein [Sphingobacteriales bacterium]|nr:MAG: (2Fe-2S)-binding protein [Sphingobacteriales bacterium]